MADEKKEKDLKKEIEKTAKLFDVAKPGKTPADATSRPVIVGHASIIKRDPMVNDTDKPTPEQSDTVPGTVDSIKQHRAAKIEPLHDDSGEEAKEPAETDPQPTPEPEHKEDVDEIALSDETTHEPDAPEETNKLARELKLQPLKKPQAEEKEEAAKDTSKSSDDKQSTSEDKSDEKGEKPKDGESNQPAVDSLVNEVSAKRDAQKQKEEFDAKTKEMEESVAKKEFFVPIGQVSRRRSNYHVAIGLVIFFLIAAVATNFGIDAGVIDLGISPLTDVL